jgi:transposase
LSPDACLGRSRGGLTTKIHGMTDALGNPTEIVLSAGHRADICLARELVGEQRPRSFIADKAYDADHFLDWLKEQGIEPVIPARRSRKIPRQIDMNLYADRHKVERCWNRLKQSRRIATRYDKTARNFRSFIFLACTILWLS